MSETGENMPADYVTKEVFEASISNVEIKIDALKESVDKALDKLDQYETRISNNTTDIAVINKGLANGEKYKLSNRNLFLIAIALVGILGNISKIIDIFK